MPKTEKRPKAQHKQQPQRPLAELLQLCQSVLTDILPAIEYVHEHEGCPITRQEVRLALAALKAGPAPVLVVVEIDGGCCSTVRTDQPSSYLDVCVLDRDNEKLTPPEELEPAISPEDDARATIEVWP